MSDDTNLAIANDALQARNHALANTLRKATERITQMKLQLQQLQLTPKTYATFLGIDSTVTQDSITTTLAQVQLQQKRMVVPIASHVRADKLIVGQEVLLNDSLMLVETKDVANTGLVCCVSQIVDAKHIIVVDDSGQHHLVERIPSLMDMPLGIGMRVVVDHSYRLVLKMLGDSDIDNLILEEIPNVTFDDIGGLTQEIATVRDAIELPWLHYDLYKAFNLPTPRGILLYGPPGNGKTLIAKAVAHALSERMKTLKTGHYRTVQQSSAIFIAIKGPELLNKYVGEAERIIRAIFRRAREKAALGIPVIVFIDEMDSLLRTRGSGVSSDTETTIVPQFLAELDGVESLNNVMIIGASNRIDMIDPAILRPGRLDVKIRINRPKREQARDILRHYLNDTVPIAEQYCAEDIINYIVDTIYLHDRCSDTCGSTGVSLNIANIQDDMGQWQTVAFEDMISGAILHNIVNRIKTLALKEHIQRIESSGQFNGMDFAESPLEHTSSDDRATSENASAHVRSQRGNTADESLKSLEIQGITIDHATIAIQEAYLDMLNSVSQWSSSQWLQIIGLDNVQHIRQVVMCSHQA